MKTEENGSAAEGPVEACLLLHGFCGTPFDMQWVAEAMQARGIETKSPLLPGHGTSLAAIDATGFDDWLGAAAAAYDELQKGGRRVAVAGFSLGGSLALALGVTKRPAAVISLSGPLFFYRLRPLTVYDWRLPFIGVLRKVKPVWPNPARSGIEKEIAPWQGTEGGVPMNALSDAMTALRRLSRELSRLTAPLLVVQDRHDLAVPIFNAVEIVRRAGSASRRLEILDIADNRASRHMITTHVESRARVAGLAADFLCPGGRDDRGV